jgi:phosphate transport system ATP-binding protein
LDSGSERDATGEETADVALARSQAQMAELASQHGSSPQEGKPVVLGLTGVAVSYSGNQAVRGVDMNIHKTLVTAFIGPSGCGKTTLLRSLNRMNDLIPGAEVSGQITATI